MGCLCSKAQREEDREIETVLSEEADSISHVKTVALNYEAREAAANRTPSLLENVSPVVGARTSRLIQRFELSDFSSPPSNPTTV